MKEKNRKEVQVLVKNLDIDTPDNIVISYLNYFGRVVRPEVIHCKYSEGPFKGLMNGNRKYFVDFRGRINMGSFHLIEGSRVQVSYSGQQRTCARCHETASICVGSGIASACEEKG